MPPDLTLLDVAAVLWFVLAWAGYALVIERFGRRMGAVNALMQDIRESWMERVLDREIRIVDSQLVGHSMASVTFFASTSVLMIFGLFGALGAVEVAHEAAARVQFLQQTSQGLFAAKLLLVIVVFGFAFFQFTWALRQYNYTCALLGAAPMAPVEATRRGPIARDLALAVTLAIGAFNDGVRSYYYALAVLVWFIHPIGFMVATAGVTALLIWRQVGSRFAGVVRRLGCLMRE